MRNIDLKIRSFGFNSCPILMIGCSTGDFCNRFPPISDISLHRTNRQVGQSRQFALAEKQRAFCLSPSPLSGSIC